MANTTYASRLQYLDADDVDDSLIDYDGLDVHGPDGHTIGDVEGFIVDSDAGRVYYVVVDSGGWFRSRSFLLPIGHAHLDMEARALKTDVTRDTVMGYPEFDRDRFRQFSDSDLRAFEERMASACCPYETLQGVDPADFPATYGARRHYAQPDWWPRDAWRKRVRPVTAPAQAAPIRDMYNEERVRARDDRDHVIAEGGETSPHAGGRAQPGDVLGIETGGERTYVGDADEDENKRRRDAERAAAELKKD